MPCYSIIYHLMYKISSKILLILILGDKYTKFFFLKDYSQFYLSGSILNDCSIQVKDKTKSAAGTQ